MKRKIAKIILTLGITISVAGWSQNLVGATEPEETEQDVLMVSSTLASQVDDGVAGETEIRNGITYTLYTEVIDKTEYYVVSDCDVSVENAEILESIGNINVTSIDVTAFDDCPNLVSVSVPDTVTSGLALFKCCDFKNCRNLNKIEVSPNNPVYCSVDGVVYSKDKTCLFRYPTGKYGSYSIPDGTTNIGMSAFYLCSGITDVTCPNSVMYIEQCAFKDSSLKSIDISDGIDGIKKYTFQGCTKLEKITLPNTVTFIQPYAFENCTSLNNLTIPGSLIWGIGEGAFKDCTNLSNVTIQNGVGSIAGEAFWNCNLKSIYLPATVTSFGTFSYCQDLQEIIVDENNPNYKTVDGVVYDKDMTTLIQCPAGKNVDSFVVQKQIKIIGDYAFSNSKIRNIVLPDNLVSIGNFAFNNCSNIKNIILPKSLENIGSGAFSGSSIEEITIPPKISKLQEESKAGYFVTFSGAKQMKRIDVVEDNPYFASYEGCLYTKDMQALICCPRGKERVKIYKGTKMILWQAFNDCDNLQVVNIPESVDIIDYEAFRDCDRLKNVIVLNNAVSISNYVFADSPNVVICCNPGSNAEQYAKENGLKYGPIPEHVHSYESEITKEPTCTEKGVKTYSCQECDSSYTEEIPMVAHVFETVTDVNGITQEKCRVCGKIKPSSGSAENTETEGTEPTEIIENEGPENIISISRIKVTAPSAKLAAGKKVKLTASVFPLNASNKKLKWSSSNKKYATVDQTGRVTLKPAGAGRKVTITAIAQDGSNKKATYKITVMKHAVKSVKIKAPAKTVKAGKSVQLKAVVKTTGKKVNKTMVWSTSNKKYATVDKKGFVKTKKAGKGRFVTITVQSTDGTNKKATIRIKIK